ncbi:MAG: hypothetical protein KBG28_15620 [Kofleriaceae bacterium]|nr:hypothetical protein [Kofleriaceae bacterium]
MRTVDQWRLELRTALREALRQRDAAATALLREALAAIDNAEAVDASHAPAAQPGVIAGAVAGLGAGEVARREVRPEEVVALLARDLEDRRTAAGALAGLGRDAEAAVMRRQVVLLEALLAEPPTSAS